MNEERENSVPRWNRNILDFSDSHSKSLPKEEELIRLLAFAPLKRITDFTCDKSEMDLHYPTQQLQTSLTAAIDRGDANILEFLLNNYPVSLDTTLTQPCGKTALMHACHVTRNVEIIRVLIERGADVNKNDLRGWNCLYYAIVGERLENVKYLCKLGMNFNSQDEQGRTPLMIAVLLSNFSVVKFLLDNGADFGIRDNSGYTAFRLAIIRKKQEQAELMLNAVSYVNCIPSTSIHSDYELAEFLMPDIIPIKDVSKNDPVKTSCAKKR